jgi:hypothetical protein
LLEINGSLGPAFRHIFKTKALRLLVANFSSKPILVAGYKTTPVADSRSDFVLTLAPLRIITPQIQLKALSRKQSYLTESGYRM